MSRLGLRDTFLRLDRRPRLVFYTTSSDKFAQAQFAFQRSGLSITEFKSRDDPYREDEDGTSIELLTRAIDEIRLTVGQADGTLFFVEDTSLRINALSTEAHEIPGLHVKEWFKDTSFSALDAELQQRENDRTVTVKSDIALHVPHLATPVCFHGESRGVVSSTPPDFAPNVEHPWLRPDSFNGWFVPDGAERPLGAMGVEESWRYDFRAMALMQLIDRIEEFAAVINLPGRAAVRRVRRLGALEPTLFDVYRPLYVVIGPTCGGKTTFGMRAAKGSSEREPIQHVEASDVVRTFDGGPRLQESPLDFALRILKSYGYDVAARRIVDEYFGEELRLGAVITGFRTIEELLYIRGKLPSTRVIYVEAPAKTRYERYLHRKRAEMDSLPLQEFLKIDEGQASLGLLSVGSQLADFRLLNDQNLTSYHQQIEAILSGLDVGAIPGYGRTPAGQRADRAQLFRCLGALKTAAGPLSTDEIEVRTSQSGAAIRHNNANKILKQYPALARRFDQGSTRLRYEITPSGLAYVAYVEQYLTPTDATDERVAT